MKDQETVQPTKPKRKTAFRKAYETLAVERFRAEVETMTDEDVQRLAHSEVSK